VAASVQRCARDRRRRVHTVLDEGVLLAAEVTEPEEAADGDGDAGEHEEPGAQAARREEGFGELARRGGLGVERLAAEVAERGADVGFHLRPLSAAGRRTATLRKYERAHSVVRSRLLSEVAAVVVGRHRRLRVAVDPRRVRDAVAGGVARAG